MKKTIISVFFVALLSIVVTVPAFAQTASSTNDQTSTTTISTLNQQLISTLTALIQALEDRLQTLLTAQSASSTVPVVYGVSGTTNTLVPGSSTYVYGQNLAGIQSVNLAPIIGGASSSPEWTESSSTVLYIDMPSNSPISTGQYFLNISNASGTSTPFLVNVSTIVSTSSTSTSTASTTTATTTADGVDTTVDAAATTTVSSTATTTATTSPVISNVHASVSIAGDGLAAGRINVKVTWATDQAADSQLFYGKNTLYTHSSKLHSKLVTSHSITISGLDRDKIYHYQVRSVNASSSRSVSSDGYFSYGQGSQSPTYIPNNNSNTNNKTTTSAPIIAKVTPLLVNAGSNAIITGSGFTSTGNTVYFAASSNASTSISNLSSSNGKIIQFTVPSNSTLGVQEIYVANANGTSSASGVTVISGVYPTIPSVPSGLKAKTDSACGGKIDLTWNSATNAASYNIYTSYSSSASTFTLLNNGVTVTGTSYTDQVLPGSKKNYYRVTAVNPVGESAKTGAVSATASVACAVSSTEPSTQTASAYDSIRGILDQISASLNTLK